MPIACLPIDRQTWVCRTRDAEVQPLVKLPGAADAVPVVSADQTHISIMDGKGKRAGLFRLLPEAPWLVQVLPFANLPRHCQGHAHATVDGCLLVGGRGPGTETIFFDRSRTCAKSDRSATRRRFEALWIRRPGSKGAWETVPIPTELTFSGKAVDGLLIEGTRIIAMDDIVTPKWVIVYGSDGAGNLTMDRVFDLAVHTSYESVKACALGQGEIAVVSHGMNHGTSSSFVSLIRTSDFRERACWSAHYGFQEDLEKRLMPPLMRACAVDFCAGRLVVACEGFGLLVADLRGGPERLTPPDFDGDSEPLEGHSPRPELHPVDVPGLATVERLVMPVGEEAGFFAVGKGLGGAPTYAWVAFD